MFAKYLIPILASPLLAYAQNTTSSIVVCVPGQCLQGYSNVSIGTRLTAPGLPSPVHLLPGQYNQQTDPQYLHNVLTAASVTVSPSVGFSESIKLPLNLQLESGLAIYVNAKYSGQAAFTSLPSTPVVNTSVPLTAQAMAISNNLVASITAGSNRLVLWESVPDVSQLPANAAGALSLTNLESLACSPACSGAGLCSVNGTCQCSPGFAGSSCEQCSPGFFGPNCQACPSNCDSCDQGISGSGRCLKPTIANAPSSCNCLNGVCNANGQCQCTTGFENIAGGLACGKCSAGFFKSSTGDCKVCGLGCSQCADTTGACVSCRTGFTQDSSDTSKCNPPAQVQTSGQVCPPGSFAGPNGCAVCDSACNLCTGPTSNDCAACAVGTLFLNGVCVGTNADGVCNGTSLIADNVKTECDSCGAKCTSCKIPNFTSASIISSRQCTGCLPGFFLSGGECVASCPDGTFVGSDNLTCQACNSSCKTCTTSSTFCLSCSNNQLASAGRCVSSCPSSTFSSSGSCLTCHPDCSSCSGGAFNQCTTCPANRPVLVNGRCLPTCTKTQFFDSVSGTCQACDSSCSSCSGAGASNCLACSSSTNVLRAGSCVSANCNGTSSVIPGLGVCLSELVQVPQPSGTTPAAPLPTVSGLTAPTVKKFKLEWWQILLMALGCAFIFIVILWCCRRRQKKKRADKTKMFAVGVARSRGNGKFSDWRWKLVRWGEKLFGHKKSTRRMVAVPSKSMASSPAHEQATFKLNDLRAAEEARSVYISPPIQHKLLDDEEEDMVDLIGSYNPERKAPRPHFSSLSSPSTSSSPARPTYNDNNQRGYLHPSSAQRPLSGSSQMSAESMYSQMTGMPQRMPDPRQPVKEELKSKFSMSTLGSAHPAAGGSARGKGLKKFGASGGRKNPFW